MITDVEYVYVLGEKWLVLYLFYRIKCLHVFH